MSNKAIEVNGGNFNQEVLESEIPVLVDFWAAWCGPCRMVSPVIDEIANEYSHKIKVAKVNVDENSDIAGKYGIMSIPSIFLFKNGKKVESIVGVRPKQTFEEMLKKHI